MDITNNAIKEYFTLDQDIIDVCSNPAEFFQKTTMYDFNETDEFPKEGLYVGVYYIKWGWKHLYDLKRSRAIYTQRHPSGNGEMVEHKTYMGYGYQASPEIREAYKNAYENKLAILKGNDRQRLIDSKQNGPLRCTVINDYNGSNIIWKCDDEDTCRKLAKFMNYITNNGYICIKNKEDFISIFNKKLDELQEIVRLVNASMSNISAVVQNMDSIVA